MNKRALRVIAQRQCGYFTPQQAVRVGYLKHNHNYHVKKGNWLHIDRGVFRLPGYADSMESDFIKWSLWAVGRAPNRQVTISYESALFYYGLTKDAPQNVHLTVPPAPFTKDDKPGCTFHRQELSWNEFTAKNGYNITTPARTLADMKPLLLLESRWLDTLRLAFDNGLIDQENASTLSGRELFRQIFQAERSWASQTVDGSLVDAGLQMAEAGSARQRRGEDGLYVWARKDVTGRSEWQKMNRSFTLIEMLVVIAILCVLAGMLMPALSKALTTARQSHCANNLQQIGTGLFLYADDNQQTFPYVMNAAGTMTWGAQVAKIIGFSYPNNALPSGLFGIFNCPENSVQRYLCGTSGSETACSYTGNGNSLEPNNGGLPLEGTKLSRIKRPGKLNLVFDGVNYRCEPWNNDGAGVVPTNLQGLGVRGCRYVHANQSLNMLYADGHIKSLTCPLEYRGAWLGGTNFANGEAWHVY